jgi:hypothetical protein
MSETLVTCPVCQIPNFTEQGLRAHRCKGPLAGAVARLENPDAIDGKASVVPDPDLPSIRKALEDERDDLISVENSFKHIALDRYLGMGLQVLKAHALFAVRDDQREGIGGRGNKTPSTVDGVSEPTSFEGWLAADVPWLPKASAYRYKRAVQGLGLTHESTPAELANVLEAARKESEKPLSLTLLANRVSVALPEPTEEQDPNTPEDKAGEARTQVDDWISRWDRFVKVGGIEVADKQTLQTLHEFHTAERDKIAARLKSAR